MKERTKGVDLVDTGLEIDITDLVEFDSEDKEYQVRRERGVPSRTSEISSRLSRFYSDVGRYTDISLDASTAVGRKQRRILTFHLAMMCRNERKEDKLKCFISYAKAGEMFCNVLLGAGLMELEPTCGQVICHPNTGIRLCRIAAMFKGKRIVKPTDDQVDSLAHSLNDKVYDSDDPITSIFLPIDLYECHWGVLVLEIIQRKDGYEERKLSFGDSLRF